MTTKKKIIKHNIADVVKTILNDLVNADGNVEIPAGKNKKVIVTSKDMEKFLQGVLKTNLPKAVKTFFTAPGVKNQKVQVKLGDLGKFIKGEATDTSFFNPATKEKQIKKGLERLNVKMPKGFLNT